MLKVAWSPVYNHPLPEGHRFPMLKYDLVKEQLLYESVLEEKSFFEPGPIDESHILWTHSNEYWQKLKYLKLNKSEERRTGFSLTKELVNRETLIMNGTIQSAFLALNHGVAFNAAGGTHHAYKNKGEGFCLLNDNAIAANVLLKIGDKKKIIIVDLDVHQGNGTASIFEDEPCVFTFSMHASGNIFSIKEQSDLDIELPDGISDQEYLKILNSNLSSVFKKIEPDFVFYQAGVDVLKSDRLGKLSLSKEGCKYRDFIVLNMCKQNKVPVAVNLGGGYSDKIADIVDAHCNTFKAALEVFF